ncbi:SPOR domain-containing protein [Nitrosophilus kaiyonis]|uniref:SPOR domain-containing protein n=1 Tax=Nitrosophilus kaiyonis TaxID=2930200 RepID=UPI0024927140|nr:SPOR domain-containing protein [Nitrosophilus kaiyonis]
MDIFDTNEPKNEKKEESHNELEDIILNKKDKKFDIKKLILLAGSAILILLIVISAYKIISQEPKNENEDFFATQTAPETENKQEDNFEQVPIIKEESKEPEEEYEKIVKEITKEETSQKTQKEENIAPKVEEKEEVKKIAKAKIPESKKIEKKQEIQAVPKGNYYVQVGAFYRLAPSKKFLKRIETNGFNYIIKTVIKDSSEIKKVLIGPFTSRSEAKKALLKIKQNIKKDAFITRIQ